MTTKDDLHRLVDQLPEGELATAERLLRDLCGGEDPLLRFLEAAPVDDEPETEEERAAVAAAWEAIRHGEVLTDEELRRELGL